MSREERRQERRELKRERGKIRRRLRLWAMEECGPDDSAEEIEDKMHARIKAEVGDAAMIPLWVSILMTFLPYLLEWLRDRRGG